MTEHPQPTNSAPTTLGDLMKAMEAGDDSFASQETRRGPKASYVVASAAKALKTGQALGADVLIVDPPRKGLEDEVLDELCKPYNGNQPCVERQTAILFPQIPRYFSPKIR